MDRALTALGLAVLISAAPAAAQAPAPASPSGSATAGATSPIAAPGVTFASGVEMVALNVTVTEGRKGLVSNLTRDDFQLFEDGKPAEIALFGAGDVAVDLAVLLDSSGSVSDRIDVVRSAAKGFLHTLRPGDRGAVIGFDQKVSVLANWTNDSAALNRAIDQAHASGGTSLYQAVYIALRALTNRGAHPNGSATPAGAPAPAASSAAEVSSGAGVRRQAIVVLSDGNDTTSLISFDDVLDAARRAAVAIYTIRIVRPSDEVLEQLVGKRRPLDGGYVMNTLARETGARAFTVTGVEMLAKSYAEIADELAQQYVLGFVPKCDTQNPFHTVQVLVPGKPGTQTRTRPGFFTPVAGLAGFRPAGGSE